MKGPRTRDMLLPLSSSFLCPSSFRRPSIVVRRFDSVFSLDLRLRSRHSSSVSVSVCPPSYTPSSLCVLLSSCRRFSLSSIRSLSSSRGSWSRHRHRGFARYGFVCSQCSVRSLAIFLSIRSRSHPEPPFESRCHSRYPSSLSSSLCSFGRSPRFNLGSFVRWLKGYPGRSCCCSQLVPVLDGG